MSTKLGKTDAFDELMAIKAGDNLTHEEVTFTCEDPLFETPFRLGETIAAALAVRAIAAVV